MSNGAFAHFQSYLHLTLTPIPMRPHSKMPQAIQRNGWNPALQAKSERGRSLQKELGNLGRGSSIHNLKDVNI